MIIIKLKTLLAERGISQKDFSIITNIRPNTIGDYCNNTFSSINKNNLDKMCEVLNCDINDLLEYKLNNIKKAEVIYELCSIWNWNIIEAKLQIPKLIAKQAADDYYQDLILLSPNSSIINPKLNSNEKYSYLQEYDDKPFIKYKPKQLFKNKFYDLKIQQPPELK